MQNADVVIWVGAGLTPWLEEALGTLAPDAPQLALLDTDGWPALELRDDAAFGGHDHGHDHGDDHGDDHIDDPHAWLDPQVAIIWVGHIAQALSDADPDNAATYRANAGKTIADLTALEAEITTMLDIAPQPFLVPHDAYQYFGVRFGHPATAAISLNDAAAPTPDDITALQSMVADLNVACVLSDSQARREWSDLVREGTPAQTAVVDPVGSTIPTGADRYVTRYWASRAPTRTALGADARKCKVRSSRLG